MRKVIKLLKSYKSVFALISYEKDLPSFNNFGFIAHFIWSSIFSLFQFSFSTSSIMQSNPLSQPVCSWYFQFLTEICNEQVSLLQHQ